MLTSVMQSSGQSMNNIVRRTASTLPQRLVAARSYAGLSQLVVARGVKRSRAAVAMWESESPTAGTTPRAEQIMAFARVCGVPAEVLLDDSVSASHIALGKWTEARTHHVTVPPASRGMTPRGRLFWSTTKLHVFDAAPHLQSCFDVLVEAHGITSTVPMLSRKNMAFVAAQDNRPLPQFLTEELPYLMFASAVAGRNARRHLLVLVDPGVENQDGACMDEDLFGFRLVTFSTHSRAAEYLMELGPRS